MFRPHIGNCQYEGCTRKGVPIVVRKGWCDMCNHKHKQEAKKAAGKKTTKYTYVRQATGEAEIMEAMVQNLPDHEIRCFVCSKRIAVLTYNNMAHILAKGKYPAYRLYTENIRIMCFNIEGTGCHNRLDHHPKSTLIEDGWEKVWDLQEKLKQQYPNIPSQKSDEKIGDVINHK